VQHCPTITHLWVLDWFQLYNTQPAAQSSSLTPPVSWQAVAAQTVVSPQPLSYDITTNAARPVFIRVPWVK